MFFKLVLKAGHVGAGKSIAMVRYETAPDMGVLLSRVHKIPRLKGKRRMAGIYSIETISREEYYSGLQNKFARY